jgi:hypothetical protein
VHAFRLPHVLHIRLQFDKFLGISNTILSLGFGILLLLRLTLLAFPLLILPVVGLTERALLILVIFWIFSHLLVFSKAVFCCTVHHQGRVCSCCLQILCIVHTMRDFGVRFERVSLLCDNTSAISVAKNLVFYKKIRHVERRHHFLRDHVEKGDIEMRYIDTERHLADIFTKPLDSSRFVDLRGEIGVCHHYGLV